MQDSDPDLTWLERIDYPVSDVEYVFMVDRSIADELISTLREVGATEATVAEVQGLGGTATDWLLVGTVASHIIHRLSTAILPYIEGRKIKSIKVGEVEIIAPRPEDVTRLLDQHTRSPES